MNNYYQEKITEIEGLMSRDEYQEATTLLKEELSMPYIPQEYQVRFEALLKECDWHFKQMQKVTASVLGFEEIEELLLMDDLSAVSAIESLKQLHLSPLSREINQLFQKDLNELVRSLVILVLIEQQVDAQFEIVSDGLRMTFNPRYVEHPVDSDGFKIASEIIAEVLAKDPTTLQKCQQLLVEETLLLLPLSYEEMEGEALAYSIIKAVTTLSGQLELWNQLVVDEKVDEAGLLPLRSKLLSTL